MNPNPQNPPQFTTQQLQQYLALIELFTGKKPEKVLLSQPALDWYRMQVKQIVKTFNIPTTKNFKKDEFMGIELVTE